MQAATKAMRSNRWASGVLAMITACALLAPAARAQIGGAEPPPAAEKLVQATAASVTILPGGSATVVVKLAIQPGWHVNANPPAMAYNIPTRVSIEPAGGLTPGLAHYPAGTRKKFSFEDAPLLVYDGAAQVSVPLAASAGATSQTLHGTVQYQACNDQLCLAPVSVPFTVAVTVNAGAAGTSAGPGGTPAGAPSATVTDMGRASPGAMSTGPLAGGANSGATRGRLESALARGGLGWFLALFAGGLLLNLTPCVFPMLGVTVSIFGARRKEPLPKVVSTAALYVLGICATYTVLGVVAALSGRLFGSALQSVWVDLVLGGLMVLLSLGMFGVYEMQPPSWLMNRLGGAQATGFAGAFVSGLGVGVIAAPCVGPFVVAVLALIAQKGDVGFGLGTMFTMSLGLGFPYLFLATFSNLIQALPRAGDWMVWVKHALGLLLASFGAYYLVLGLAPQWIAWVAPVALALSGLWLGFIDKSAAGKGVFRVFATTVGGVALCAGAFTGAQLVQAMQRTLTFKPYDPAAVKASVAAGRPVMMDFSADWCLPCHELETTTFSDPRVVAAAKQFDRYKVDLTKYDSPEAQALRKQYGISGVPIVVFLGPDGNEVADARVDGFLAPDPFLDRLKMGAAR